MSLEFLFAALLFFPMTFVSFSAYQDFVINAYIWLFLEILYRLPEIARIATASKAEELIRQV